MLYNLQRGVIKCTQIQHFSDQTNYHFKHYVTREMIVRVDLSKSYSANKLNILKEVSKDELKDTTIEFIDSNRYKKLVNKGKYKEYLIGE